MSLEWEWELAVRRDGHGQEEGQIAKDWNISCDSG
jgi:hypothetical protein